MNEKDWAIVQRIRQYSNALFRLKLNNQENSVKAQEQQLLLTVACKDWMEI